MKRFIFVLSAFVLFTSVSIGQAAIGNFIADSNQFGYSGNITNTTDNVDLGAFPTPRDAAVYFVRGATAASGYSAYNNSNQILSNWYQHPTSNQNPGFFQLYEDKSTGDSVISATASWTQNGGLWDFTFTVSGVEAPYPWSRLWQPDSNMAWGGIFETYTYTLTATGMTTTVAADGWRYNTSNPTGITGSFDGSFTSTFDVAKNPITDGDSYSVHLDFNKVLWDGTDWSDTYTDESGTYYYGNFSKFGAPVPEPATIIVWSLLGGLGIALCYLQRKR